MVVPLPAQALPLSPPANNRNTEKQIKELQQKIESQGEDHSQKIDILNELLIATIESQRQQN